MAVKLRLMRMGKKKQPTYRIVAADSRSPRDGRFIEIIGTYEPRKDPSRIEVDAARAVEWLIKGAKASDTVRKLLEHSGAWEEFKRQRPEKPAKPGRKRKEQPKKAAKKAVKAPAKAKKAAKKVAAPVAARDEKAVSEEPGEAAPAAEASESPSEIVAPDVEGADDEGANDTAEAPVAEDATATDDATTEEG
ncbi:MAG: 30S ribosomal protein S16 [Acidimicrobiales bacterium]